MKVYQFKRQEIFMSESFSFFNEERLIDKYNALLDELLLYRNISDAEVLDSINILNSKITSAPHIVKALLMKEKLPAFKFLVCKN